MTTQLLHIEDGFRLIDGELINAMIDAIVASGVSTVSVVTANGVSGTVANPTTTPAITIILGNITPSSVASAGSVTGSNLSGTNTGDQTIMLTGDVTGAGTGSFAATIAAGAVSLVKMANLAANSIIGNNTGSPATPIALTATQTKTLLSLNNVENTALSTWAGSTSLTTLGTVATGVWSAGAITTNSATISGGSITGMPTPMNPSDVATKAYTDSVASGGATIVACNVATMGALTATYNNGAAGVGATLTNSTTQAPLTIDTVTVLVGYRVLVKDQVSTFQNGIYVVTTVGTVSTNWVLTRTSDYDQNTEILNGSTTTILQGAAYPTGNLGTQWFMSSPTPTTVGTDAITFGIKAANFLIASSNLSDLTNNGTARTNLGLGTAATQATGIFAQVANNLSDLASASTARTNLGLGSIATQAANNVTITGGAIDGAVLGATTPMQIQGYRPTNLQTGTTYTLALSDTGQLVTLNNASAITLTVPTNASVAFATNTEIDLAQLGAGQVTIAGAGGVTITSYSSNLKLAGQGAGATLKKIAINTWLLVGNLSA